MSYAARLPRTPVLMLASAIAAAAAVLAVISVVGLLGSAGGSAGAIRTFTAPGHAFRVALPDGWNGVPAAQLTGLPSAPVAILRRADGRGLVTVEPSAPIHSGLAQLARSLTAQLRHRFKDFRLVGARLVHIRAGQAFAYTFVRAPAGTVQTIVVATANGRTWTIDAVVPGNAPAAAHEAGSIVATFGP